MMNYLRIFLFVLLQALVVSRIQLFDGLVLPFTCGNLKRKKPNYVDYTDGSNNK